MILRKFKLKSGAHAINGLYAPDEYEKLIERLRTQIDEGTVYQEEYEDILEQVVRSTQDANDFDIRNGAGKDWKTFVIYPEHILNFVFLALQMPAEAEKSKVMVQEMQKLYDDAFEEINNKNLLQLKNLCFIIDKKNKEIDELKNNDK